MNQRYYPPIGPKAYNRHSTHKMVATHYCGKIVLIQPTSGITLLLPVGYSQKFCFIY